MSDPSLPDHHLDVWFRLTAAITPAEHEADRRDLSTDEDQRSRRFVHAADARDYITAHTMLRRTLSRHDGRPASAWRFVAGPTGKPRLADTEAPLAFNLSHTRGLVACVVANSGDVGIDVEARPVSADIMELARLHFAPMEVEALARCTAGEAPLRFAEFWTLKESFVKATGEGITVDLSRWGFRFDGPRLTFNPPDGIRASDWTFALFAPTPDTRMAVAASTHGAANWTMRVRDAATDAELAPVRSTMA